MFSTHRFAGVVDSIDQSLKYLAPSSSRELEFALRRRLLMRACFAGHVCSPHEGLRYKMRHRALIATAVRPVVNRRRAGWHNMAGPIFLVRISFCRAAHSCACLQTGHRATAYHSTWPADRGILFSEVERQASPNNHSLGRTEGQKERKKEAFPSAPGSAYLHNDVPERVTSCATAGGGRPTRSQ